MDLKESSISTSSRRHPWELARVRALRQILGTLEADRIGSVIDIGCGDGYALGELFSGSRISRLVGVDSNFDDRQLGALKGAYPLVEFARSLDEVSGPPFDLMLLLDVVEHIADDRGFLSSSVEEWLAEGGHLLLTAPAFQALFSAHDRFLGHQRRYRLDNIRDLAVGCGLRVIRDGYLFASLVPARLMAKGLETLFPGLATRSTGIGGWRGGALVTRALELVLMADNLILGALGDLNITLPGLTVWALCRKRP